MPVTVTGPAWRAALGFGFEWLRVLFGHGGGASSTAWHLRLALVWSVLIAAVVLLTVNEPAPVSVVPFGADRAGGAPEVEAPASTAPAFALDLSSLGRSRMTAPPVVRARPQPTAIVPDLANELQLHGVIGGDDPRAIIFHKRTQQTHTVRVGQKFGEFEVIEIHSMRVLLRWRDETIELSI